MEYFITIILPGIISGQYTSWFFNIVVVQFSLTIINNFALLWLIATTWQKISKHTKNTWDDRLSTKFVNWLSAKKQALVMKTNAPDIKGK